MLYTPCGIISNAILFLCSYNVYISYDIVFVFGFRFWWGLVNELSGYPKELTTIYWWLVYLPFTIVCIYIFQDTKLTAILYNILYNESGKEKVVLIQKEGIVNTSNARGTYIVFLLFLLLMPLLEAGMDTVSEKQGIEGTNSVTVYALLFERVSAPPHYILFVSSWNEFQIMLNILLERWNTGRIDLFSCTSSELIISSLKGNSRHLFSLTLRYR